jgi:hypothetical protein
MDSKKMKRQIKKWTLRLTATGLLLLILLIGIVLKPLILYANHTTIGKFTVYHSFPLDENFSALLDNATTLIKASELYDSNLKLDICLNDGSNYPKLMRLIRGQAFGWGFADKVVLMGNANFNENTVELNGYKWNFTQLLAHEETHCLQFHKFGFRKSNPVASHPNWKWEGYPEYVARRKADQLDLTKNIARKLEQEKTDEEGWAISFSDGTISPREYYNSWLLVQYCLDIKKMTYESLLADSSSEQTLTSQMMNWYSQTQR